MHESFGFPVRSRGLSANATFTSLDVHCVFLPYSSCKQLFCAVAVRGSAIRTLPMKRPSRRSPPVQLGEVSDLFIAFSLAREKRTRPLRYSCAGKILTCACLELADSRTKK